MTGSFAVDWKLALDATRRMEPEPAERLMYEVVGRLMSALLHEVRNPLAVMLGFTQEALREWPCCDRLGDDLREINQQSLRIKHVLTGWQRVLTRDVAGLDDDLHHSGRMVWPLFAYRATNRLHVAELSPERAGREDMESNPMPVATPWLTTLAPQDQIVAWVLALMWLLERSQPGTRIEPAHEGNQLRFAPAAGSKPFGADTPLAQDCLHALEGFFNRRGLNIDAEGDSEGLVLALR